MNRTQVKELLAPEYVTKLILKVHRGIRRNIRELPVESFKPYWFETATGKKQLAVVDLMAERAFIEAVTSKFHSDTVRVIGEESLYKEESDLKEETRTCLLIDMIDGTDLLQRGFSNWCSAIVVFEPKRKEITGAFIAVSGRSPYLYFATKDKPGAFKKRLSEDAKNEYPEQLKGPAKERELRDASVCLYAQKSENFLKLLSLNQNVKFVSWLKENLEENKRRKEQVEEELRFRFYNFAGNPMMVRLAEGNVDVVLDLRGQAPHDVVPGAFIAIKAEAVLGKTNGEPFSLEELGVKLCEPSKERLAYILAANDKMLKNMAELLSDSLV